MVKNALELILLLCCSLVSAQSLKIEGKIVSSESNEPVPFANIYLNDLDSNRLYGTISDTEGSFILHLPSSYKSDTLQISFVGFESSKIPVIKFLKRDERIVKLQPSVTYLSTVTVRDLSAKEFFIKCIEKIKRNYLGVSFINGCFYWQSQKEDSTYKSLNHAYLTILENIGTEKTQRELRIDSTFRMENLEELHFLEEVENIFNFDFIRLGTSFLKAESLDEWTFAYNNERALPENYVVIDAVRLDKVTRLKLLVNDGDYSIEEVDYSYNWKKGIYHTLNDTLLYTMGDLHGKVMYKKNSSRYNLKYIFNAFSYSVFKKLTYKKLFTRHVKNEIVTFSSQELKYNPNLNIGRKKPIYLPGDFVIINKGDYCEAAGNLNKRCD